MIRIMIVDDQTPSRKQIRNELADIGYTDDCIFEAANGITALETAKSFNPDILITDISMPRMLGTELAQRILSLYPKCKIIFFSGYPDKVYLKTAIKLNVVDFLEKPLDSDEFKAAVKKAEEEISRSTVAYPDEKADAEFIECLVKNKKPSDVLINDTRKNFITSKNFVCAAIVPCSEYMSPVTKIIKNAAVKYSVNMLSRFRSDGTIELLLCGNVPTIRSDVEKIFNEFLSKINDGEIFKCAVGSFEKNCGNIHISYENASSALDSAFFFKPNTLVIYKEPQNNVPSGIEKIPDEIYSALAKENYNGIKDIISSLYKGLFGNNYILSANAKKIYYNIFETIHSFFKNYFLAYNDEYNLYDDTFNIHKAKFLDELNNHILSILTKVESFVENSGFNTLVKTALYYMEQNYTNPNLSIVDIAQHCNINANYLCGTFKSVTNETINHYINSMRVEKSKKLIVETNKSIAEISRLCGFNDAKYFCKVFGKYTKTTPSAYRKKFK